MLLFLDLIVPLTFVLLSTHERGAEPPMRVLSFLYGDQRLRSLNPCCALLMFLARIQLWSNSMIPPPSYTQNTASIVTPETETETERLLGQLHMQNSREGITLFNLSRAHSTSAQRHP
ncbi:uncharacterized protein HD556DRAFT_367769 [Suillus plorans]|uniref:Uncharacterized protein n=1 Tax=Suillus plorans TaxID=116603 RepID=A0A9P7DJ09_9AGAM|nr:uncharacterized protein HD556DRAFT_367769 [Suillus plorans]KAG1795676.1 hypothetical protein HD556DRAFT_367769 [Suillus plorans]